MPTNVYVRVNSVKLEMQGKDNWINWCKCACKIFPERAVPASSYNDKTLVLKKIKHLNVQCTWCSWWKQNATYLLSKCSIYEKHVVLTFLSSKLHFAQPNRKWELWNYS